MQSSGAVKVLEWYYCTSTNLNLMYGSKMLSHLTKEEHLRKEEHTDTQVNKALWKASRIMQLVLLKHEESHQLILKVLSNMTEEECRNS